MGGKVSILGAGLEEVIDFRNREIAYFRTAGISVGSAGVAGASVTGFSGFGWKGVKTDWPLQQAYTTQLWNMLALDTKIPTPLPITVQAGLGIGARVDADPDCKPWLEEKNATQLLFFGASIGAKAGSSAGASVRISFGQDHYKFLGSECFDDKGSFIKALWLPICTTCGKYMRSKKAMIGALRTVVHAVSFPIITEIFFTFLASKNELKYKGVERQCSKLSINNMKDPRRLLAMMYETVRETMGVLELIKDKLEVAEEHFNTLKDEREASEADPPFENMTKVKSVFKHLESYSCVKDPTQGYASVYMENTTLVKNPSCLSSRVKDLTDRVNGDLKKLNAAEMLEICDSYCMECECLRKDGPPLPGLCTGLAGKKKSYRERAYGAMASVAPLTSKAMASTAKAMASLSPAKAMASLVTSSCPKTEKETVHKLASKLKKRIDGCKPSLDTLWRAECNEKEKGDCIAGTHCVNKQCECEEHKCAQAVRVYDEKQGYKLVFVCMGSQNYQNRNKHAFTQVDAFAHQVEFRLGFLAKAMEQIGKRDYELAKMLEKHKLEHHTIPKIKW
eukprot:TRINITY_DN64718_c0_g1_i1.p1 TRINITY_DN64718_c0_g1~~TRINITY_DN64718_c0_g1_i1.p1  ORF type:complete len:575 (-),score=80.94 TRINITY_DN64718_c0_g1_i1:62-1753(-)